jgi:DNA-binding NarL/FixJ family response regulator
VRFVTSQEQQPSPDLSRDLKEREVRLREVMREMQQLLGQPGVDTTPDPPKPPAAPLNKREIEILRMVAEGETNQQIGRKLRLSAGTVRNYNGRIFRKLGVAGRTQAAVRAIELGIVSRPESHDPRAASVQRGDPGGAPG